MVEEKLKKKKLEEVFILELSREKKKENRMKIRENYGKNKC